MIFKSQYLNPPEVTSTPASLENAYDAKTLTVVPENEDESISSTEGGSYHENGGGGGISRNKVHPISQDIASFPLVHRKQGVGAISSINDDRGYQNRDQHANMQQEKDGGKSKPKIVIKRKINQVCLLSNNFQQFKRLATTALRASAARSGSEGTL